MNQLSEIVFNPCATNQHTHVDNLDKSSLYKKYIVTKHNKLTFNLIEKKAFFRSTKPIHLSDFHNFPTPYVHNSYNKSA